MQRLSGIDPMFIYSDTPETPMEIAYACIFDPGRPMGATRSNGCATCCSTAFPH